MMNSKLNSIFAFTKLLHELQKVERVIRVPGSERWENDCEHSFSLAMLAWFIIEREKLPLNLEKVLRYALAHDLVEVYAGDTYVFTEDKSFLESKNQREAEAADRLVREFPELTSMHDAIERYTKKDDPESRFVYALDKIEPALRVYLDNGRTWKEKDISLSMLIESKLEKVNLSPEVKPYFDLIFDHLKLNEQELFHKS